MTSALMTSSRTRSCAARARSAIRKRRTWRPLFGGRCSSNGSRPALTLLRVAAVLAVLTAVVMLGVPQARALITGWFRIGVINILPEAPAEVDLAGRQLR